jgi:uncharacterized DUF497 family protein
MDISFDPAKRAETLRHRKLGIADAGKMFSGDIITVRDKRRDYGKNDSSQLAF